MISSGTIKISAFIFRATEMASLANAIIKDTEVTRFTGIYVSFCRLASMVVISGGVDPITNNGSTIPGLIPSSKFNKNNLYVAEGK